MIPPADAAVRDLAVAQYPELAPYLGASGSAVSAKASAWILWARGMVSVRAYTDYYTLALALAMAHACVRDAVATEAGALSALLASGAVASSTVLGMSISLGGGGLLGQAAALSPADAELATTIPGARLLALRSTRARANLPFVAGCR